MKIFIGFDNTASTVTDICNIFRQKRYSCFTALKKFPNVIDLNTADYIMQKEIEKIPLFKPRRLSYPIRVKREKEIPKKFFERCLHEFDVFIFLWETFFTDYSDLEILKQHGKKIVFVFTGDDARWHFSANQEFKKYGLHSLIYPSSAFYKTDHLRKNLERIRMAEKYSDHIFSRLDQGQLHLRPYHRWNMMIDSKEYQSTKPQNKNPLVIHAPSAFTVKGSAHILDTLQKLKREGIAFNFQLIENLDHLKFKKLLSECDILIDQLFIPGTGKISTEALGYGKVVLSNMSYKTYPQKNPDDCPIIDVNPDTIYEQLKKTITDLDFRKEVASRSRLYVEKYLDTTLFCDKVEALVKGEQIEPDYQPDFFRNHYLPEAEQEYIDLYNETTDLVKDCGWYKKNVTPGTRAGLQF